VSEETVVEVVRESALGHHMLNTFQNCPRRWYVKYICSILPQKLGKALIFGKAWHEGMEVFYRGDPESDQNALAELAYNKIVQSLLDNKKNFKAQEELDEMLVKAPLLFKTWFKVIGANLHTEYKVLAVEEELRPKLGGAFTMTIRPDAVVKHRASGAIMIPEHKTTSYSINSQLDTVTRGDQATAYIWGLLKVKPELAMNFQGVLLDVCYNRGMVVDVKQTTIIRAKRNLAEFELNILGIFLDLANRIRALETKPEMLACLFPRNGSSCSMFGCEYESICRNHVTPDMVLGSEFMIDKWKGKEQLLADTEGEHLEYRIFSDAESIGNMSVVQE